jgi:hypothetical protein
MTGQDDNYSSVIDAIQSHHPHDSDFSKSRATILAAPSQQQPKHGLRRWVEAGNIRIYLLICTFYPLAQGTRIISDFYVRFWTEKTYFSSQQDNLETYSCLVGG